MRIRNLSHLVSGVVLISVPLSFPAPAMADGGSLRLSEERGNYQIAIFTSPTPLRAGPVDISALVQDAASHEPVSNVQIAVKAARRDGRGAAIHQPATFEAATNKLFELAGTRSTLAAHNLDRHWRNARTHTLHDPVRWKYAILGNYFLNGVNPPLHAWS